ncbi:glycosyltransferase [Halovenus sp. WSH3]|uniref:Glycosyltransferase n=1 Tax=Halovenus carboxidivorans TaxID=2692199 RepID=A0A6B0T2G9_9EURY|nr:glycosyltransferase family 4 protein [Halovenus carboxidivorans]MXR50426.1 glycosyltransferase [Halovenus carboxidivorans]
MTASKISLIGYSDLGTQTGQALTHMSRVFYERDRLERVYCRGVINSPIPKSAVSEPIPFGNYIPKILTGINKYVWAGFENYAYSTTLFDSFTARKIEDDSSRINFHYTPGYVHTLERGKSAGKEIVVRGSSELVEASNKRYRSELAEFGIDSAVSETHEKYAGNRRKSLRKADKIIALSEFVKASYADAGISENKITVVPLGINSRQFPMKPDYRTTDFTALFVGSVNLLKGVPYLLKCWNDYGWKDNENAKLQLCGGIEPEIEPILEMYRSDNVSTPGVVDPLEYYHDCSVFVFPSLTEGFAKAPLEAMSTGTPVIVTDNSGVDEIIEDGKEGFVVPTKDTAVIDEKLRYFRDNPRDIRRMGQNARETAEEYTWDRHVGTVLNTLDE